MDRSILWLDEEKLRSLRLEDEPEKKDPDPTDPFWENIPVPTKFIKLREIEFEGCKTHIGDMDEGSVDFVGPWGDILDNDQQRIADFSGGRVTITDILPKCKAVAVFESQGRNIVRYVHSDVVDELEEEWEKFGVGLVG